MSALEAPPAAGMSATWLAPYQRSFGSQPATYAIVWPSGLKTGAESRPGLVVTTCGIAPSRASTTKMSVFSERSASGSVRLLTNAMRVPSGDQAGFESSKGPELSWKEVFFATSNTWTCERTSFRYPSPSLMNCSRRTTIGFAVFFLSLSAPSSGASGSSSETTIARRFESGDQAKVETPAL